MWVRASGLLGSAGRSLWRSRSHFVATLPASATAALLGGSIVQARKGATKFGGLDNLIRAYSTDTGADDKKEGENSEHAVTNTEKVTGDMESQEFQAETAKLLDIVAHSLYSEKEVFVREVISNASDALEKLRHFELEGKGHEDPDLPLEIRITTDEEAGTITIQDTGIGMSKDELMRNLGTIAHSGSKAMVNKLEEASGNSEGDKQLRMNIIGQFGVGFYSTFMVATKVNVYSKSAEPGSKGYAWESDGRGKYTIAEAEGVQRGTKIVITLRDDDKEYAKTGRVEDVIKKYSNFVGFGIYLNGQKVNTVQALWTKRTSEVTTDELNEFYRFVGKAWDDPLFTMQFMADAPIDIKTLLFFPTTHTEKFGMGRLEPGVHLYARKVLIKSHIDKLLPQWLRFVKGVVDSEDIPLNISREMLQDNRLVQKIGDVVTGRILKFLNDKAKSDPEDFKKFYNEFQQFLKEGVLTDMSHKQDIASLLRFESSAMQAEESVGLKEYIERMKEDQEEIYYHQAASRELAESSPYFEVFKDNGYEVLFCYDNIDDIALTNLGEFSGKKIKSIESGDVKIGDDTGNTLEGNEDLVEYLKEALGEDRVNEIKASQRLVDFPCVIVDHQSQSTRRIMQMIDSKMGKWLGPQTLEVNFNHPLIKQLNEVRTADADFAKIMAEQLWDNALIAAGLLDDPKTIIKRVNTILGRAAKVAGATTEESK
eukprot:Clim_evm86s153 gene=Clim_evmTU86s153